MKQSFLRLIYSLLLISLFSSYTSAQGAHEAADDGKKSLYDVLIVLDQQVFDAFNLCSDPKQLKKHAAFFTKDVEFYHDNGGVTWTREAMLRNTKKHACGNYRRELVADSVKVFPVKDFGAIEQGVHRFCSIKTGKCEGMADFVIVWKHAANQWKVSRVLSYGHRENQ
jgi:hypothetical protein